MDQTKELSLVTDYSPAHIQAMREFAGIFIKSGAMPSYIRNPETAIMVMQAGTELGFKPVQSLNNLYPINGKIALTWNAMAMQLRNAGIRMKIVESTPEKCTIEFTRPETEETHSETYTIEEARAAGLTGKDNWKKYPTDMLRARCGSRGARFIASDVVQGMYTVEEMSDVQGSGVELTDRGVEVQGGIHPKADATIKAIEACGDRESYNALRTSIDELAQDRELTHADKAAIREACKQKLQEFEEGKKEPGDGAKAQDVQDSKPVTTDETAPANEDEQATAALDNTIVALKNAEATGSLERDPDAPPPLKVRKQLAEEGKPVPATTAELQKAMPETVTGTKLQRLTLEISQQKSLDSLKDYCKGFIAPLPLNDQQKTSLRIMVRQRARKIKEDAKLSNTKVGDDELAKLTGF